jgi:signal transduction histidine kinase
VVQDVHGQYAKEIERAGLDWKFQRSKEQLREIPMDKAKIQTVLKILIHNAINYSEAGGTITVVVGDSSLNGKEYQVFSIKDSGIGIPKEDVAKVFEKFYRSGTSKLKAADGTGLGLFIVKNFVEAHQGLIKIESEGIGKGTTISFALPTA